MAPGILVLLAAALLPAVAGAALDATQLVRDARAQIGVTVRYDASYRKLAYPAGDVPPETGVCCDVVIRALRKQSTDLQVLVHEDMKGNFARYPSNWGLRKPDPNIDHRRVPNLQCYFRRAGWDVGVSTNPAAYRPGDVVTWNLRAGSLPHIGMVSDRRTLTGVPLIIHNIGQGTREEDILFAFPITGHYRAPAPAAGRTGPRR
jgi:hypothetical protein